MDNRMANPVEPEDEHAEVARLRAEIAALKEMDELKDRFLSVASHELRTPLTTIKGYTQMLQRDIHKIRAAQAQARLADEKHLGMLDKIIRQTSRMTNLVDELLDASRIQEGRLELNLEPDVDVVSLARDVVARQADIAQTHSLSLEADAPVSATLDPQRIEVVLAHLISNAAKYSEPDTSIVVGVTPEPSDRVRLWVRDSGYGIASEDVERVFERFYRIRSGETRAVQGLGLGLFISHALVGLHGGRMWVESTLGKGSHFFFTLPRQPMMPAPTP